jgi:regulator of ribonuclease activity A
MSFSTADLCDHYLLLPGSGAQYALPGLVSYGGLVKYHGPIATIAACEKKAVRLLDALAQPGNGRILVVDNRAHADWAVLGDRLAERALANGWVGIVLNGFIRDVAALREMPIGVHALGVVPARPPQFSAGEQGAELRFLNVRFNSQDWVYADEDGVVVLPKAAALEACKNGDGG